MAEGLVRSFGNQDSRREDEGFGLWREIDRVFDNLARSFGRDTGQAPQKGFAQQILAPHHELPEIPLQQEPHRELPEMPLHREPHRELPEIPLNQPVQRAQAAQRSFAEQAPRPSHVEASSPRTFNEPTRHEPARPTPSFAEEAPRPMQQAKAEALSSAAQPTPIRLNRSATSAAPGPLNPIADAYEDEDNFEIAVELPGVRGEDIDIEFAEGGLNLTAERKRATETGDEKKHHVRERSFGTYKRRFPVPFQANPDIIRADFEDGVLLVTVPRPPETKPRVKKIGLKGR